jgi:hypothetical protein
MLPFQLILWMDPGISKYDMKSLRLGWLLFITYLCVGFCVIHRGVDVSGLFTVHHAWRACGRRAGVWRCVGGVRGDKLFNDLGISSIGVINSVQIQRRVI